MGYTGAGSNVPLQLVADLSGMADKPTQDKILEILLGDFGGTNTPDDGTDNVFLTIKNILSNLQTDVNTVKNAIGEGNLTFDQAQNIKDTLQNAGITVPEDASMQDILSALDKSIVNKDTLKNALTSLGVSVSDTDTIPDLLAKINNIITLDKGTADATAVAGQMLAGTTAYVKGKKVSGTIPSLDDNRIIPGTADKVISAGNYLAGAQTIAGDANLIPQNIAKGKSIFGVAGAFEGGGVKYGTLPITSYSMYSGSGRAIKDTTVNLGFKPTFLLVVIAVYSNPKGQMIYTKKSSGAILFLHPDYIPIVRQSWVDDDVNGSATVTQAIMLLDNGFRVINSGNSIHVTTQSDNEIAFYVAKA